MSAAVSFARFATLALLLHAWTLQSESPTPAEPRLLLASTHMNLGEELVVRAEFPAATGIDLRFAEAAPIDPAFVLLDRTLEPPHADAPAAATFRLLAAMPGSFDVGPVEIAWRDASGQPRQAAAPSTRVSVSAPWGGREIPPFGELRGPVDVDSAQAPRWPWAVAAIALLLIAGRIAQRRSRRAPVLRPTSPPTATLDPRQRLMALAADPPADATARRAWFDEVHGLVRQLILPALPAATSDRTTEELASTPFGPLLAHIDAGRFARTTLPLDVSRVVAAQALDLLGTRAAKEEVAA